MFQAQVATDSPFDEHTPDFYIPVFTILEFICYSGWIKVAETLLNPFGDDDEDFEINYLIDRNLQVSYIIVDDADTEMEVIDPFAEAGIEVPPELPYKSDKQGYKPSFIDVNGKLHCRLEVNVVEVPGRD